MTAKKGARRSISRRHVRFLESSISSALSTARYIVTVESAWLHEIQRAILYCYEFPTETFSLFDRNAGYYISYKPIIPLSVRPVYNVMEELLKRNVELRFTPTLKDLADAVTNSTLHYSLIRMKNATVSI